MFRFRFDTKVQKVEHKSRVARGYKDVNGDSKFEYKDLGWFVNLEGSRESLYLGDTRPDIQVGQQVTVTLDFE